MKIGTHGRILSPDERALATRVFGPTLPPWGRILVDDGLGFHDAPYTLDGPPGFYVIHIGPKAYPDCTSTALLPGFGRIDAIFIHEMTHVWQYGKGYNVKLSSMWAQTAGEGYGYVSGKPWDDYNVEQQAAIVEDWYTGGMSPKAAEFPYIDKVIRTGGGGNSSKPLVNL